LNHPGVSGMKKQYINIKSIKSFPDIQAITRP